MFLRWVGIGFALGLAGCSTLKDVSPYGEPFRIDREYVAASPVSAYVGDTPIETDRNLNVPDQHSVRDAVVLAPGTRLKFVRKDYSHLVFLVLTGDERARYAWVNPDADGLTALQPVTTK